jgi:predicted esterase YcpF (UPF0227 family)
MHKNYSQWKNLHYMWDNVRDFEQRWNGLPGVHTIRFGSDQAPIDIFVNEHVSADTRDVQPIFFTGAISDRGNKKGPFFSGLRITNGLKLPMIAVADPSLDDDLSLSLAWYTGGPNDNYELNLARVLEVIQRTLKRELLFVGGSGGGYAALNIGCHFDGEYSVLVWNPQTDIYEYLERFVKTFLKSRFNFSHSSLARPDWKEYCRIRTDSKITTNVLSAATVWKPRRLVYLQNANDWHRAKHLMPLWSHVANTDLVDGINRFDSERIVFLNDFAEGHTPPSVELIGSLMVQLMSTSSTAEGLHFDEK